MQESTVALTFTLNAVGAITSAEESSGRESRWEQEWVARKESIQLSPGSGEGFTGRLAHLCTQVPGWGVLYPTSSQPARPRSRGKGWSWDRWAAGPQRCPEPAAFSKLQGSCSTQRLRSAELSMFLQLFWRCFCVFPSLPRCYRSPHDHNLLAPVAFERLSLAAASCLPRALGRCQPPGGGGELRG